MIFLRFIFILVSILFSISSNCQISYSLSNKFWRLKYAKIGGKEYAFNSSNDNAPTLQFNGANIRGNGGCNAYHTKFTINGSDAEIGTVNSTRMNCTDMYLDESSYFRALGQTQTLSISGDNEFTMFNALGDKLVFFAQFARSSQSAMPPARREYSAQQSSEEYVPRNRSRASKSQVRMSRRELSRQKALEKKMNSKRKGKLTKAERRELMALQSKQKKTKSTVKAKRGREKVEGKKKGKKSKKDQSEEKSGKKTKKGKKENPKSTKSSKSKKGKEKKGVKKKK
jgi:heat shock protein HslJ